MGTDKIRPRQLENDFVLPGDKIADGSIPLSALSEMPTAEDVGARSHTWLPTPYEIGAANDDVVMRKIATYYGGSQNKSVDDLTEGVSMVVINNTLNPELYNILGCTFAFVITVFYSKASTDVGRAQIALPYNATDTKMAIRNFNPNSQTWTNWRSLNNLKIYTEISQLGITIGSETIKGICEAMPDKKYAFMLYWRQ